MRAETESGLPIPVCWASTSMVSQGLEPFRWAGETRRNPFRAQNTGCVPPRGGVMVANPGEEAPWDWKDCLERSGNLKT